MPKYDEGKEQKIQKELNLNQKRILFTHFM